MRRSLPIVLSLALSLASLFLVSSPAAAGANWCEGDPVFTAGGNLIDVTTTFSGDYAGTLAAPLDFELLVPSNALLPAVISLQGSVPVSGRISRTLPPSYSLLSMPVVLRVSTKATASFTTYTRVTGVTKWGWSVALLNTVSGTSNSVQQYRFALPLW